MQAVSLISDALAPCGVEDFARRLAEHLEPCGAKTLALSGRWSDIRALWRASGEDGVVCIVNVPLVAWKRRIVSPVLALVVARLRADDVVLILHDWSVLDWRRRMVLAPMLVLATKMLICKPGLERELQSSLLAPFLPRNRATLPIPSNVAVPRTLPETEISLRLAGLRREGRVIIGQFGSIYPKKGNLVLLEVVAELRKRGVNAISVFVGSFIQGHDIFEKDFWAMAKSLDLEGKVIVSGYVQSEGDLFAALGQIDVFVYSFEKGLSSNRGSVLAVALSGRPIVANAPSSQSEFDHHPTYRDLIASDLLRLVPTDSDVTALANGVQAAIEQPSTGRRPEYRQMWADVVGAVERIVEQDAAPVHQTPEV